MKYPSFRLSQGRTALANHKDSVDTIFATVAPEWRSVDGDLDEDDLEEILRERREVDRHTHFDPPPGRLPTTGSQLNSPPSHPAVGFLPQQSNARFRSLMPPPDAGVTS